MVNAAAGMLLQCMRAICMGIAKHTVAQGADIRDLERGRPTNRTSAAQFASAEAADAPDGKVVLPPYVSDKLTGADGSSGAGDGELEGQSGVGAQAPTRGGRWRRLSACRGVFI